MLSTKDFGVQGETDKEVDREICRTICDRESGVKNMVKLKLLVSMRIYPVVNMSRMVRYRKPGKRHQVEKPKLVEVNGAEEWEVEKILNKRKVRGVIKYLVWWKGFTAENDM